MTRPEEVIRRVRAKRLIFTVTTGRSGTAYLAAVLSYMKGVSARHEPAPEFVTVLRDAQRDPSLATRFLLGEKLPAIAGDPAGIYAETSHLACKGFLEPLLELGIVPDLIIHRRAVRDIAKSLYRQGTIPGRTEKALRFYLTPDDPGVMTLKGWTTLDDYQLCYWYCLEIERRARKYRRLFLERGATVTETTLTGLKTAAGLKRLLEELRLSLRFPAWLMRLRYLRNSRFKVNASRETVKRTALPANLPEMEHEVIGRLEAGQRERWLPELAPGG